MHWKVDESGSKGAQNELYLSVWAPHLDLDLFWKTMVLTRFRAICGPKLAHFQGPFDLQRGQNCPTWAQNGLIPLVCANQIIQKYLWENTFLIHFSLFFGPKTTHFQGILSLYSGQNGLQWAQKEELISLVYALQMVQDHFWKNTFLTHFSSQKQPIFKAFCDSTVAKMACNGLKRGSFHLFRHPKWSRIIFGKTHF